MTSPLRDDKWKRRGISVLWDGDTLAQLEAASRVVSLRHFVELYEAGWPDEMPLLNDDALYVAGLDVAVDALSPSDAVSWLESEIYEMVYDFQNHADAGLVFWMPDSGRWKVDYASNSFLWFLGGEHDGQLFPMGRCIWNGAERDVRKIEYSSEGDSPKWIGLFLERIS